MLIIIRGDGDRGSRHGDGIAADRRAVHDVRCRIALSLAAIEPNGCSCRSHVVGHGGNGHQLAAAVQLLVLRDGDGQCCRGDAFAEGQQVARHGAVGDVGIAAAYTGGVLHVGHFAGGVVVVLEGAFVVIASDGAVVVGRDSRHGGADGEVVVQGAVLAVGAYYAAVVVAVVGVGDGEGGGADTVFNGASIVHAHDATVTGDRGPHGADGNVGGHVAAVDGTIVAVVAHDAADVVVAGDAGVGKGEVVDVGAVSCPAEDALVVVCTAVAVLVDTDTADGLVIAVEVAAEDAVVAVEAASDGLEVVLVARKIVPVAGVGVVDVVGELEVLAAVAVFLAGLAVCAVDAVGQQVELVLVIYHVGVVGIAVALGGPVDDGEADCDGHVLIGHGERIGIFRAAERSCAGRVAVLVACGSVTTAVRECETHLVTTASVEVAAVLDARRVSCDATDVVFGGIASICHGDVLACRDAAGSNAVVPLSGAYCAVVQIRFIIGAVAEVVGVVAVVGIYLVAGEGGAAVVLYGDFRRGEERVIDFCPAFSIADEAADGVGRCAEQTAVEQAAGDGERAALLYADDAAVGVVAADGAGDGGADGAVVDADGAPAAADETAGELLVGSDGARDVQVAEGSGAVSLVAGVGLGVADVAEGGDVLRGSVGDVVAADIDGQRVALSVEGAAEVVLAAARHACDGILRRADVVAELHGLAAEAVVGVVVVEAVAEDVPARGGVDGVRAVAVDGEVGGVGGAAEGHGGIGADVERIAADGRAVDTIFIDPARGGGGKRDGSGVVVRAAVREGGRGVGGGAVGEGELIDALVAATVGVIFADTADGQVAGVVVGAVADGEGGIIHAYDDANVGFTADGGTDDGAAADDVGAAIAIADDAADM